MPRRRAAETMERDAEALEMFRDGRSYREIASALGWASPSRAFEGVRRAIADRHQLANPERRDVQRERLEYLVGVFGKVVGRDHYAASSSGAVVLHPETGKPLIDDAPVIQAGIALIRLSESLRRMDGLDAPKQVEVRHIDAIDARLLQLADEVGAVGPGGKAPVPRQA